MELSEVIKLRKSVRKFADRGVEREELDQILEAARLAPSWKNWQCWSYIVIDDRKLIRDLASSGGFVRNLWLRDAPVVIVSCGDPKASGDRFDIPYYAVDVAISMEHLILAATDLGLGTCWVGIFDEPILKAALEIPDTLKIVALTPLGYPADKAGFYERSVKTMLGSQKRRQLAEITHFNKW